MSEKSPKRFILPVTIGLVAAALLTVAAFQVKKQVELLMKYCYKIKGFKIRSFTKDRLQCSFTVLFRNKSNIGVTIRAYTVDISLNGKFLGTVSSGKRQELKPAGVSELFIDADLNPKEAFTVKELAILLSYLLIDKSRIVLTFEGKAKVQHSILPTIKLPFKFTYTLKELLEDETGEEVCVV